MFSIGPSIRLSLIAANLAAVCSLVSLHAHAAVVGTCLPQQVKFSASATDHTLTTSATFINVPEGVINFTQGGQTASCVIVHFTSLDSAGTGQLFVRAVIDGATVGLPELYQFNLNSGGFSETHTATFIFPNVAPGAHQIRMQFSSGNGQQVLIGRHNTIAMFAP